MIHIVLVRPSIEENIGFVSRVIENMGADQLILIDPQCSVGQKAYATAASGIKALKNLRSYAHWSQFLSSEKFDIHFAFTCRTGQLRPTINFKESVQKMVGNSSRHYPIYLVFGPENHGLSNDDLLNCQTLCHLPSFGSNPSLNLSHAVLLSLYILQETLAEIHTPPPVKKEIVKFPEALLKRWLVTLGYDLSKKTNAYSVLRQFFLSAHATKKQVVIFEKVLQQNIRLLCGLKNGLQNNVCGKPSS